MFIEVREAQARLKAYSVICENPERSPALLTRKGKVARALRRPISVSVNRAGTAPLFQRSSIPFSSAFLRILQARAWAYSR